MDSKQNENESNIAKLLAKNLRDEKGKLKNYNELLQLAKFSDLSEIKKSTPFINAGNYQNTNIIFMFGVLIPTLKGPIEKSMLYFISLMEDISYERYVIVVFLNGTSTFEKRQLTYLKNLFEKLPFKYYHNLQKIITVNSNFLYRSDLALSIGFLGKFIRLKTLYLDNFSNLESQPFFRSQFWSYIPKYLFDQSDIPYNKIKDLINPFDNDLRNEKILIIGRSLEDFALAECGIPYIMLVLTAYFEYYPDALKAEGIFRISGGIGDEKKLEELLEEQKFNAIFSIRDPIVVGGVFKQIFGKMPKPLFEYKIYDELKNFNNIEGDEERIKYLKTILSKLPSLNRQVLYFLLKFFQKVISYQQYNKMNSYNLAVCFSPCLLKPEKYDVSDLLNTAIMVSALRLIIEKPDQVIPEENVSERQRSLLKHKSILLEEWERAELEKKKEIRHRKTKEKMFESAFE